MRKPGRDYPSFGKMPEIDRKEPSAANLSQKELAKLLKTSQQQISRLESPGYEGHSLSMLRRVANTLHAKVRVYLQ